MVAMKGVPVVACLILLSPTSTSALWGGSGSEVIDITSNKDVARIKKSPYVWAVALYREGCGYCELLKPEWGKTAKKLRKMAGIAAVDVVTHSNVAQSLQQKYNIEVKGVPTIVILKPEADGTKTKIVYEYERKAKQISSTVAKHMPEFVARITSSAYKSWEERAGNKIILFSNKKEVPSPLKALSTKYKGRLHFGFVDETETKLKTLFGVTEYPSMFAVESGKTVGNDYIPVKYNRSSNVAIMDLFVMEYAAPKKTDSSSTSKKSDTTSDKSKKKKDSKRSRSDTKKSEPKKKKAEKKKSSKKTTAATKKKFSSVRKLPQPENPITLKGTDLHALSVKELRGILARWDDPCNGCAEKDNFIMKIRENQENYGDMEDIAKKYAKKQKKARMAREKRQDMYEPLEHKKEEKNMISRNADDELDDPLCTKIVEMETDPLIQEIEQLRRENEELKAQLEEYSAELIHEEL